MGCGSKRCEDLGCFGMCDDALPRRPDPDEHWQLLPRYLRELAAEVPNRLFGATINHEGDAI